MEERNNSPTVSKPLKTAEIVMRPQKTPPLICPMQDVLSLKWKTMYIWWCGWKAVLSIALPFLNRLMMAVRLIIWDSPPPPQLGQNRHNMWRHEIHCDTVSYQCQQREGGGGGGEKQVLGLKANKIWWRGRVRSGRRDEEWCLIVLVLWGASIRSDTRTNKTLFFTLYSIAEHRASRLTHSLRCIDAEKNHLSTRARVHMSTNVTSISHHPRRSMFNPSWGRFIVSMAAPFICNKVAVSRNKVRINGERSRSCGVPAQTPT